MHISIKKLATAFAGITFAFGLGTTAWGATEAQIVRDGEVVTPKGTLAEMVAAAQTGDTIQLLKDVEQRDDIQINDMTIALDLNGKTLTLTEAYSIGVGYSGASGSLTIYGNKNAIGNGGKITRAGTFSTQLIQAVNGTLIIDGGTYELQEAASGGSVILIGSTSGAVFANGCSIANATIIHKGSGSNFAVRLQGTSDTTTITNCTIRTETGTAITGNGSSAGLKIIDCNVTGKTGVTASQVVKGNLLVEGCTIEAAESHAVYGKNATQSTVKNCQIVSGATTYAVRCATIEGTENVITATTDGCGAMSVVTVAEDAFVKVSAAKISTSKSPFNGMGLLSNNDLANVTLSQDRKIVERDPSEEDYATYPYAVVYRATVAQIGTTKYETFADAIDAAEEYKTENGDYPVITVLDDTAEQTNPDWKIANGLLVKKVYVAQIVVDNGATTNKYETLAEAITAAQNGDTIEMLADVDFGTLTNPGSTTGVVTIPSGKTVTLDLAGHKISVSLNTNGSTYYNAHVLLVQGNLTIEDTSVEKTGEFINTCTTSYECTRAVRVMSGGTLTMNGGTVTATTGEGMRIDGTATLNAGVTVQAIKSANYGGWDNAVAGIELRGNARLTVNGAKVRSIGRSAIFSDAANNVITLNSGVFTGSAEHGAIYGTAAQQSVSVRGGYYSSDPTDFINPQQYYAAIVSEGDYAGYYEVGVIAPVLSTVTTSEGLADALAASTPQAPAYVTVSGDITIDTSVELPFGATLTIPDGSAVRVVDNGVLINNGEITSEGTLEVTGTGFLSNPSSVDGVLSGFTLVADETNKTIEWVIETPMDLQWISWIGNQKDEEDFAYSTYTWDVKVANDIVFPDGVEFEKIYMFTGVFDGQGHEISNLVLRATSDTNAIFHYLSNATILDTEISATVETVSGYTGTLAYRTYGTVRIDGVTLNGTMTATGATYGFAPFVAMPNNAGTLAHLYIGNCVNNMTVSALNGYNVGAVCGTTANNDWLGGKLGVYNFVNNGTVVGAETSEGYIVGYSMSPNLTIEVINYENHGSVSTQYAQIAFDSTKPETFCYSSGAAWSCPVFDLTYASTDYTAYYHADEDVYNTIPPPVAQIVRNNAVFEQYATLAAAIDAAVDGDTIELLTDIQLSGTEQVAINKVGTYVIDGKGFAITPAADSAYVYERFKFGMDGEASNFAKSYTITNLTITGFTDSTYFIRNEGCSATFVDCTITNNNLSAQSNSRLVLATASNLTMKDCLVADNTTASYLVDFNTNGSSNGTVGTLDIDGCLFDGNTVGGSGLVYTYGSSSGGDAIRNSTFSGNTVNSAAAAIVYFSGATDVTGCFFTNNTVTATDATQKCGILALGSGAAGIDIAACL